MPESSPARELVVCFLNEPNLLHEVLAAFVEAGVHSSTVIESQGMGHILSQDMPVVIEVVDTPEKIDGVMPQIDEMIQDGLVTLEKVRVVRYAAR